MAHQIGIVGGDGIGPEVIAQGLKVIDAAGVELNAVHYDLGGNRYARDGLVLTDEIVDEWRGLDAIYLGAVGTPDVPPGLIERGLLLKMRFDLDLYINLRPFSCGPDTANSSTVFGPDAEFDFVVIRENTEGAYAGEGGFLRKHTAHEIATQGSVNTHIGVQRCVHFAFELAMERRKHVTLVHKTNVLNFAGDLWERTFNTVAEEFPQVTTTYNHVDAACIYFVDDPFRYDVIVTDNLFGDILTDLGGAVSGGIGFAASANIHPGMVSMFEPVHGSAPDIAGSGKANPTAAILSGALMLDHLGEHQAAERIRAACSNPETLKGSTKEIGDMIAARL
ncbi:MAG: 3-isopropylmalate dehydrogenase [Acidimicrobiia bacterium]|nr:3-isopropylmalate dehydrogenase [Acidimicrobiia bacterium]MCY4456940.1 3-isopropylmalate dehydrogenase [Acidimicrobiaceae bacterium]